MHLIDPYIFDFFNFVYSVAGAFLYSSVRTCCALSASSSYFVFNKFGKKKGFRIKNIMISFTIATIHNVLLKRLMLVKPVQNILNQLNLSSGLMISDSIKKCDF